MIWGLKLKKTKAFQKLQQKTIIHLQRHHELPPEEADMLRYIEKSRKFSNILDELADKIISKWKLS